MDIILWSLVLVLRMMPLGFLRLLEQQICKYMGVYKKNCWLADYNLNASQS